MQPIIRSLMDIDFYKFTMGQLAYLEYSEVLVRYAFKNRTTSVNLLDFIDLGQLREELNHVQTLRFNNSELHYLRGTNEYGERMFREPYLEFLRDLRLPDYKLSEENGTLKLEFWGKWPETIYWETIALSIINELYYRSIMSGMSFFERDCAYATGQLHLAEKIKLLREHPDITFSEFGTRRRFSREWQWYVVEVMANKLPNQLLGTSNTLAAMDFGLLPMGTNAHEIDMIMSGIMHDSDEQIRASHQRVLRDWWEMYGWGLSIALTDTYGTEFFLNNMTEVQAQEWKGLRHDSGDPIEFGKRVIRFYQEYGIDPLEKLIIFSDGLDIQTIIKIADHFRGRIKVSFGWGTNLTNDLGFRTLSLVIKAVWANGHGTVKLSDNLAKAIGQPEDIERFKRIFRHTITTYEECIV